MRKVARDGDHLMSFLVPAGDLGKVAAFFATEETLWDVHVEPYRERRSRSQSALAHVLIGYLAHANQTDPSIMKEWCKEVFGPKLKARGQLFTKPTRSYTKPEASEFIEKLLGECMDLGIDVSEERQELGR